MATTVRFHDDEKPNIEKAFVRAIGQDAWYRMKPFWYKHNAYGTWEVYTDEEMETMIQKGQQPKIFTQLMQAMLYAHGGE